MKRAKMGTRVVALAIDVVGVAVSAIIFENPVWKLVNSLGMVKFLSVDTSAEALMIVILTLWGAGLLYLLTDVVAAATPGKMLMRLKIRREDGQKARLGNLLTRYILKCSFFLIVLPFGIIEDTILSILFLFIGLMGFAGYFLILGDKRQALHDRLSHTSVFRS